MQATAVVAVEPGRVAVQTVAVPEPGPEEVVLRVTHSWISNGTEGSFVRGERIAGDTPRTETDPLPFPHVPGYQKVGIVERVGTAVTGFAPGDAVFATVSKIEGMFFGTGGHVSPAVTHQSQTWRLPPHLDPVAVSGLVLTQVGYNIGMRPVLSPGEAAIVLGDGMVGHWSAQTLQHRGAKVLLIGKHDERLRLFDTAPHDATVNSTRDDLITAIKNFAPNGVQVLADTVGDPETVESLYPLMRRGGQIVSAGFCGVNGAMDVQKMRAKELSLHAPAGWSKERMDATLHLLSHEVLTTLHLITHRFPVAQAAEAYDLILSRREPVLGVVLDW
jgi:bacteriochlorophyllide a dehydrogenase